MRVASEGVDVGSAEFEKGAVDRLAFFSDAVVAIAITLLALELPVPEGATSAEFLRSFAANGFVYFTFLIAFAVVGMHWAAHHRLFRYLIGMTPQLMRLNMAWLLMIVITPYLTRVVHEGGLDLVKFTLFAVAQALTLVIFAGMAATVERAGLFSPAAPVTLIRRPWLDGIAGALGFLVSIPAYLVVGGPACLLWVLAPAALVWGQRALEARRPAVAT